MRNEYRRPTHVAFVDFAAAFDSVDRPSMWAILEHDGVPHELLRLLKAMYSHTESRVRVGGSTSLDFDVATGVRQGAILSPVLFTRAIDWVMERAVDTPGLGLRVGNIAVPDLTFADDIALLSEDPDELQIMLDNVSREAARVGLVISSAKTKIMCSQPTQHQFSVNGQVLGKVKSFKYLGNTMTANGDAEDEVRSRRMKAQAAFSALQHLWNDRNVTLSTKMRVYMASVRPVLMYGCETWPLNQSHLQLLVAFEHRCWRKILHIPYSAHVTNVAVRQRVEVGETIEKIIQHRRVIWFGHVARMEVNRLPRITLFAPVPVAWRRRQGGQRTTWRRRLCVDLGWLQAAYNISARSWPKDWLTFCAGLAMDRPQFRQIAMRTINS